jgi:hypothetical protein
VVPVEADTFPKEKISFPLKPPFAGPFPSEFFCAEDAQSVVLDSKCGDPNNRGELSKEDLDLCFPKEKLDRQSDALSPEVVAPEGWGEVKPAGVGVEVVSGAPSAAAGVEAASEEDEALKHF